MFPTVCGIVAFNKERGVVLWVVLGFIFGAFALVVIALLPERNKWDAVERRAPLVAPVAPAPPQTYGKCPKCVTNLESGASRVVNASGPATFTFREDSLLIRSRGRGLVVLFPGELGPGSGGGVLLTDGLVVQVFDGEGLHVLRLPHTRRNLCRELAQ